MRVSELIPPPDDPAPTQQWHIIHRDNFDREAGARTEVTGVGRIPAYAELWARFLFESVKTAWRVDDGRGREVGSRGFSEFTLELEGGPTIEILGAFERALVVKRWVFGTVTSTMRGVMDEADRDRLVALARAHLQLGEAAEVIVRFSEPSPILAS